MSYLWTLIPFLVFMVFIAVFQVRHARRRDRLTQRTETIYHSLSQTMNGLHIKTYGRPSTDIEKAFPEITSNK